MKTDTSYRIDYYTSDDEGDWIEGDDSYATEGDANDRAERMLRRNHEWHSAIVSKVKTTKLRRILLTSAFECV